MRWVVARKHRFLCALCAMYGLPTVLHMVRKIGASDSWSIQRFWSLVEWLCVQ
jgi:hypothetical protein